MRVLSSCNGGPSGCEHGLDLYNWSVVGAPLLAHRVRKPRYVAWAYERLRATPYPPQQPVGCAPLARVMAADTKRFPLACGHSWEWCVTRVGKKSAAIVHRVKKHYRIRPGKSVGKSVGSPRLAGGKSSGSSRPLPPGERARGRPRPAGGPP